MTLQLLFPRKGRKCASRNCARGVQVGKKHCCSLLTPRQTRDQGAGTDDQNWGVLPSVLERYKLIYSKIQLFLPTRPGHPFKHNPKILWVLWQSKLLFASSYRSFKFALKSLSVKTLKYPSVHRFKLFPKGIFSYNSAVVGHKESFSA